MERKVEDEKKLKVQDNLSAALQELAEFVVDNEDTVEVNGVDFCEGCKFYSDKSADDLDVSVGVHGFDLELETIRKKIVALESQLPHLPGIHL